MGILVNTDTGASDLTVACVLKSGGDFDAEYVERLWSGVRKHLGIPHRFVCLSDVDVPCERIELKYDLPGWWSKMELFRPDITGDIFYLDLDIVIIGDLGPITGMDQPRMFRGHDSSVMSLPEHCRSSIWGKWIESPQKHMDEFGGDKDNLRKFRTFGLAGGLSRIGDQAFIRSRLKHGSYPDEYLIWYPDIEQHEMVAGPKILNKPKDPMTKNAAAVVFNYRPRPKEVNWLENRYGAK